MKPRASRRARRPADVGDLLGEIARRSGDQRLRAARVESAVKDVLGPHLARRLASASLEGDILRLDMATPAAAREIERHAREIADRLAVRLGPLAPARIAADTVSSAVEVEAPAPLAARPRRALPLAAAALSLVADPSDRLGLVRWMGLDPGPESPGTD